MNKLTFRLLVGSGIAVVVCGLLLFVERGGPDGGRRPMDALDSSSVATTPRPLSEGSGTEVSPPTLGEGSSPAASDDRVATGTGSAIETRQLMLPPVVDPTSVRDVSWIDLFPVHFGRNVAPSIIEGPEPTVEEILDQGLRLAGASLRRFGTFRATTCTGFDPGIASRRRAMWRTASSSP